VCLLLALHELRRLLRIRIDVFHFDHRLRRSSPADAAYVRRLAARLGVPFHRREGPVPMPKGSVEMWARHFRMKAAHEVRAEVGATAVAMGHTRSDQAETVLMYLITGSATGLSGIPPRNGPVVHPLLDVDRADVEAFCKALRLRPRRDPTNRDASLLRNGLRLRGIPALERASGRAITGPIARVAEHVRADQDRLWDEAVEIAPSVIEVVVEGCRFRAGHLLALPAALRWRVVRRAFQMIDAGWTHADVDAVLDLAAGRPGRRRDLTGGLLAHRDRVYVSVSRSSPEIRV
jgi:tRNA(Ile)-lysidine synthase